MQVIMIITVLFLNLLLIDLTTSQIPNPNRYRMTVTINGTIQEHYTVDNDLGKISRMWFSNITDERFRGNQEIYVRNDGLTYMFNYMSYPSQCIANRGEPYSQMNYWSNIVKSFGGENKTYDKVIFDQDCLGACLTWSIEYYLAEEFIVRSQLFIKKADCRPIKLIVKLYSITTANWISTDFIEYID